MLLFSCGGYSVSAESQDRQNFYIPWQCLYSNFSSFFSGKNIFLMVAYQAM